MASFQLAAPFQHHQKYIPISQSQQQMRKKTAPAKVQPKNIMILASMLASLQLKRKSYSLQLLKQFILFPDESQSSQKTVSKFDSLIFSDELLHTMFKKLQTKLIERKIWGFLNLKYHRYCKAIQMMQKPIDNVRKRAQKENKAFTFIQIKVCSEFRTKTRHRKNETCTTIQTPGQGTPIKKQIVPPIKYQSNNNNNNDFQISIDITHKSTYLPSPRNGREGSRVKPSPLTRQSPSYVRFDSRIDAQPSQLQKGSIPQLAYPISQIHPMQPRYATQTHLSRNSRLRNGEGYSRERSRSGSVTRYELDADGSRKRTVNGVHVPYVTNQVQNGGVAGQIAYVSPSKMGSLKSSVMTRAELQKQSNLQYEYRNMNSEYGGNNNRAANEGGGGSSRVGMSPSKAYGRVVENSENSPACHRCGIKHAHGVQCTSQRSGQKVIRLRSSSKQNGPGQSNIPQQQQHNRNGYLQHLQN